jgi:hypothetical protein
MADLYLGVAIIAAVSAVAFAFSFDLGRRCTRPLADLIVLGMVVGIFAYIQFLWYDVRLVQLLPFSNLIVLGNWFPVAASALAGFAWHLIPGRVWRKSFSATGLITAAFYSLLWPLYGSPPDCERAWTADGICLQTTAKTCTPACAATVLRRCGIEATEAEMAELCLTREGTTWQGLYRGLKRKTAGTGWDVEVLQCDAADVLAMGEQPVILSVGLPKTTTTNQQAATAEWGWMPGIGHSVTLLGRSNHGRYVIADPAPGIGREEWTANELRYLFRGTAMRLVRRSASAPVNGAAAAPSRS